MKFFESTNRTQSLLRLAPDLFNYKSVLYVGAKPNRHHYADVFHKKDYVVTFLEVFDENVAGLLALDWINEVIKGDVRNCGPILQGRRFDVVFFWHGPEHLTEDETLVTLPELERLARRLVVLGCPWGTYQQGAVGGNPFERHVAAFDYEFFETKGYAVECLGEKNVAGSNITSVKRL